MIIFHEYMAQFLYFQFVRAFLHIVQSSVLSNKR